MNDKIKKNISEWLDKHGYPLEMFVASAFQKNGFQVTQSVMYLDHETGIQREIDIVAHKTFVIENFFFHFSPLIECKSTKSKPWLSFMVKSSPKIELQPTTYNATRHGEILLKNFLSDGIELGKLFPSDLEKHAYSLTQAFREGEGLDIPYKAIQTLSKAFHFLIKKVGDRYGNVAFYFPIVAIENPLFEIELTQDDLLAIEEVEQTIYLGRKAENNNSYFIVDIITKSAINNYAKTLGKLIDDFYNKNIAELTKFVKDYNTLYSS